jgi:hypothetical protein
MGKHRKNNGQNSDNYAKHHEDDGPTVALWIWSPIIGNEAGHAASIIRKKLTGGTTQEF